MMQNTLAIAVARLAGTLSQKLGRGAGTSLPGKIASRIAPQLLGQLALQLPKRLVVTGSNGKSTTSGLIHAFLEANAQRVAHNLLGANMRQGLLTALMAQSNLQGELDADVGVFEVDEATLPTVAGELQQQVTVVTNLFRDQLDRYGELDTTAKFIRQGIEKAAAFIPEGKVILNADDPIVCSIALQWPEAVQAERVVYYGVADELGEQFSARPLPPLLNTVTIPREVTDCPKCSAKLNYRFVVYGHLGSYACSACDFERPRPQITLEALSNESENSAFQVRFKPLGPVFDYHSHLKGRFNIYNILAAMAATQVLQPGYEPGRFQKGLDSFTSIFGRSETRIIDGKRVELYLIKNPIGASEVLETIAQYRQRRVLIALNDNAADGKDVSWIWDAPFEWLTEDPLPVMVSGQRAPDMALRLHYAGLASDLITVEPNVMTAMNRMLAEAPKDTPCVVLPTYTALLSLTQALDAKQP